MTTAPLTSTTPSSRPTARRIGETPQGYRVFEQKRGSYVVHLFDSYSHFVLYQRANRFAHFASTYAIRGKCESQVNDHRGEYYPDAESTEQETRSQP